MAVQKKETAHSSAAVAASYKTFTIYAGPASTAAPSPKRPAAEDIGILIGTAVKGKAAFSTKGLPAGDYTLSFQGPYLPEVKTAIHVSGNAPASLTQSCRVLGRLVADTDLSLPGSSYVRYRLEGEPPESSKRLLGPTLVPPGKYPVDIASGEGSQPLQQSVLVSTGLDSQIQIPAPH